MRASLYGSSRTNVPEHIQLIYADGELEESATCRKSRQLQKEENRNVNRETLFYNLAVIIAVGYRVNSKRAIQFRQWATAVLRDFAIPAKNAFWAVYCSDRLTTQTNDALTLGSGLIGSILACNWLKF